MPVRDRPIQQKFFINQAELDLIQEKMDAVGIKNKSSYYRKMVLDGFVIKPDYSEFKQLANEINKVGVNINQVVHLINTKGQASSSDVELLTERLDSIWLLLKSTLSKQL